ncbi:hypothetical protein ACKWTF_003994 [Chironomus riparius]
MRFLKKQLTLATFVFICHIASGERWSRQLTSNVQTVNDWVPITQDVKSGKSITFGDDLVPAAQTQFQFFTEPLNNRFNLQQSHPAHPAHPSAAPSEINSFIQNSPPQFQFLNPGIPPQQKQRTVQNFGGSFGNKPVAEQLIQNPPQYQFMQEIQRTPQVHHYQSQPIPKSQQTFTQHQPVPAFQNFVQAGPSRVPHFQKLPTPPPFQQVPQTQQQQESEQPVQLLYVPFDSLYQQNQQQQQQQTQSIFGNDKQSRFNILNQPPSASLINDFYSQNDVNDFQKKQVVTTTTRRPTIAPATVSYKLTTPFDTSSKLKPHQPPLSMFVAYDKVKGKATETDVLSTLRSSNTIDVMDSINERSPKVFIGPSGMSPPNGYSKFELPYLSSIDGTRNERKIDQLPFFVAPLSYKTPPGFSKIPLPAPHVGSVVVNQPNSIENNESNGFTPDSYYTKQPQLISTNLNNINRNVNSNFNSNNNNNNNNNNNILNETPKKNTQTVKLTSGFHFGPSGNVQLFSNEFTFPTLSPPTTQQPKINNIPKTTPKPTFIHSSITPSTPLTKVKASLVQEYHSTLTPTTIRTPTVTRSKYDEYENTRTAYFTSSVRPTFSEPDEYKTVNEEYFKVNRAKPSISTSFEYDFESKQQKPKKDFNFKPIPEFNFDSVTTTIATKKPKTTKSTTIKQTTTTSTTQRPTTTKEHTVIIDDKRHKSIDFSFQPTPHPTPSFEYTPTVSIIENTDTFRQTHGSDYFTEFRSTPRPTQQNYLVDIDELNRHKYKNGDGHIQNIKHHDFFSQEPIPATESPQYNLPSELPPISAQLPDEEVTTTTAVPTTVSTTTRRPTQSRGRRPVSQSTYRTVASTAEPNYERKQSTRGRRPPSTYSSRNIVSATEATFPSRSTPVRSSKIKYNITSDDQSKFRTRNRRPVQNKEENNIAYQRDVLNQNYPSSVRPPVIDSFPATERIVESIHIQPEAQVEEQVINDYNGPIESIEVIPLGGNNNENYNIEPQYTPDNPLYYENTIETTSSTTSTTIPPTSPTTIQSFKYIKSNKYSANDQEFAIPQHKTVSHRLKGNFNFNRNTDSFYNGKTQELPTTQATEIVKDAHEYEENSFSLVPSTTESTTTTTEAPVETEAPVTRRTSFPRRRLYTTTTSEPQTDATESYGSRNKEQRGRKENVVVVKKVRTRTRPTTTTTEVPETTRRSSAVRTRPTYASRNVNNRERGQANYENNYEDNRPRFRIRENTQRFRLDTQESQWSSRFNQNSFQPIDEEKSKAFNNPEVDDNQEIVTANPNAENETYLVNVSASVLPSKPVEFDDESLNLVSTTEREDDLAKRTKIDDDLDTSLDKLMKDVMEDIEKDTKSEKKLSKLDKKSGPRRGTWKRVKVRPADGFETAETQNIGKHLYNAVADNDKVEGEKPKIIEEPAITTTISPKITEAETTTVKPAIVETTILPEQTVVDDSNASMFDDARKAFVEFLSSEEDTDDAVNMEEADDKLERDSTTTTQIPTTEEPLTTTTLPPTTFSTIEVETSKPKITKEKKQIKTSTSQKVTGEICFRGKCIKTNEK